MSITVEVIAVTVEDAIAAERGGAGRLELVADLAVGGVTPALEVVRDVKAAVSIPVFVMVRPRGGDFIYSETEIETMVRQAREIKDAGADGIVVGALLDDGGIDRTTVTRVAEAADLPVTFHKAFDQLSPQGMVVALKQLAAIPGMERVLTAGGHADAAAGRSVLADLVRHGGAMVPHGLSIMPGGGVTLDNAAPIVRDTGVRDIHVGTAVRRPSTAEGVVDEALVTELVRRLGHPLDRSSAGHV